VHVFTISRLDLAMARRSTIRFPYPPLWFTEGLAEFWSKEWDTEAEMVIKDMVLGGRLFTIDRLYEVHGTYLMYKLGESICGFIDSAYGPDKLTLLFDNWHKGKSFDEIVKLTLGDNLEVLSRKWEYALKKKYFPQLADQGLPRMESERLTSDGFSTKGVPISWNDGKGHTKWVVFKANRYGYTGIYMKALDGRSRPLRTLLKGERSSRFESLYLLQSGIDANDSGMVIFSSKFGDHDVIYLYDLNKGKVVGEFSDERLVAARSPRLSPDGRQIVFSGVDKSGFCDLYLLDLTDTRFSRLTQDLYYDIDPAFTADGSQIVFASDRCDDGATNSTNLYRMNVSDRSISRLTYGKCRDRSPDVTSRGIFFSSDRNGSFNIFLLDPAGELTEQSTYATAAFDPRLASDGATLTYSGYQDIQFQIYEMKLPETARPIPQTIAASSSGWTPPRIDSSHIRSSIKYDTRYSFDIAQSTVGYDPVYGSLGGLQGAVSDVLGNKAFYFLLANTAQTRSDFLSSFNFGLTYVNRERRANWGVGVFHLYDEYFNDNEGYYEERQAGAIGLLSYPLSKFSRIDNTLFGRYSKRDRRYGLSDREAVIITDYVSWVYDNSIWDISGPIEGRRYNLSVGTSFGITDGRSYNRLALADIRHYFRLGKYSAFANRLFGFTSSGVEPQRLYLGGSWSFRGFDRRHFYNRNILFASNELRFPLINDLQIGTPLGLVGFRGIRGALFFDTGSAWDDEFDQFYGSFGGGFRVNLANIVLLRFDFSRTTDFSTISPDTDFDFFFGWNF
jgi:Tol biopolymer transport system component